MAVNLDGLRVVVTGKIANMTRSEATQLLEACGAVVETNVTPNTDVVFIANLFSNPANTSKYKNAIKYKICMLDASQLHDIKRGVFNTGLIVNLKQRSKSGQDEAAKVRVMQALDAVDATDQLFCI